MYKANLTGNTLYSLILTQPKKSVWESEKRCGTVGYVCPDCGYIELYAEKPKVLKP
jgi:predicted nucleic-acid-binding Zn-ribbon protein